MALGALPYHGRVTSTQQLPSGDIQLQITVTDNSANVLSTSSFVYSAQLVGADVNPALAAIRNAIFNQMLSDGGSFAAAAVGLTDEIGE